MLNPRHSHQTKMNVRIPLAAVLLLSAATTALAIARPDEAAKAKDAQAPQAAIVKIVPPLRQKPQAGSVLLRNGLIYSGMCSRATTLAPVRFNLGPSERFDQQLEMRLVDQKAREIYLPVRRSESPSMDNLVWPNLTFSIRQKRIDRKALPAGIPDLGPFDSKGIARGKLHRANGKVEDIQTGIVAINELYAEVLCLTHDWSYCVAFDAIPRNQLESILTHVDDFHSKPDVRLNLVRMLIKANCLPEAASSFEKVKVNFPELAGRQDYQQQIREQLAGQITAAIEERRNVGQHQLAENYARVHPKNDLTPETIVRVNQLIRFYTDTDQRIDHVRTTLAALAAQVEDPKLRESVNQINRLVTGQIDADTIDRFAAFELVAQTVPQPPQDEAEKPDAAKPDAAIDANGAAENKDDAENEDDDRVTPEELLAMGLSGWLMGADNTLKNLRDVVSLFDAREAILDYLSTDAAEAAQRQVLADRISKMEGVGIARVAAIVRGLPAISPARIELPLAGSAGQFTLDSGADGMGAVGIVPPEYHETRQYPVVVVFHGHFDTAKSCLTWWQNQAEKNGYIVVAPEWRMESEESAAGGEAGYGASADTHTRFLTFVRKLKKSLRIDDDRLFVAGHDLGGEVAMDMVTSHPDLFAGIVSICSAGRRHLQWTAPNAILLPWYVVMGDSQGDWFERMGILSARLFKRDDEMDIDYDMVFVKYPFRGLERYAEEADDVFQWMARQTRVRQPEKVYAKILRSTDLHWSWISLKSLPPQYAQLDAPSNPFNGAYRPAELNVRRDDKNLIRIRFAPSDLSLMLAPDIPGLDVSKPIRIASGKKTISVDYRPEISHLLDELYRTGDRSRLCYMRIDVTK